MKKVIAALLFLTLSATPLWAENLLLIWEGAFMAQYVDADSIEDRGEYVEVLEKRYPKGAYVKLMEKETGVTPGYFSSIMALDKKDRRFQLLSTAAYDEKGEAYFEEAAPFQADGYLPFPVGSVHERLYTFVMTLAEIMAYEKNPLRLPHEAAVKYENPAESLVPRG